MVRLPSAQPVPRVPRSRRDDRLQKGHALPPKRGGIGIVISREGDTVTVLISEELVAGCIPLTSIPPVDAIVEVEARGDLMVILAWEEAGAAQPLLGQWYFTPDESPDWAVEDFDSYLGMGTRISNPDIPAGPGLLWNTADFEVHPGEVIGFSGLLTQFLFPSKATAQLVILWAEHGADPQPDNGEIVGYGTPLLVDGEAMEFSASATVPPDFDKPPGGGSRADTGRARIGLRFIEVAPDPGYTETTVDIPAHNLSQYASPDQAHDATLVGGVDALATTSLDSYIEFDELGGFTVGNGSTDGSGFGMVEIPAGSVLAGYEFVALGQRMSGGGPIAPGTIDLGYEEDTATYPTLTASFGGQASYPNIEAPIGAPGEDTGRISATFPIWDLIVSIGTPPPPDQGLSPRFFMGPGSIITSGVLRIYYLAIRVTYRTPIGGP